MTMLSRTDHLAPSCSGRCVANRTFRLYRRPRQEAPGPRTSLRARPCAATAGTKPKSPSSRSDHQDAMDRRRFLGAGLASCLALVTGAACPRPASAALVQFPVTELNNRYFLVRAGEGIREGQGTVYTNPVYKTSVDSGLDETGKRQVVKSTAPALRELGAADSPVFWAGINTRSYQTAEILAALFNIGRSRIVPEYSFLDARGLGHLEGHSLEEAEAEVAEGDLLDPTWKMAPTTDGTPHESVNDILVRVRQMMSVLETQFFNEDVIIVAPDSDNLSILQAATVGADLRQHRQFAFLPGEVRQLELGTIKRDDSPMQLACPRPPACV